MKFSLCAAHLHFVDCSSLLSRELRSAKLRTFRNELVLGSSFACAILPLFSNHRYATDADERRHIRPGRFAFAFAYIALPMGMLVQLRQQWRARSG